jgi:hypothetical protein
MAFRDIILANQSNLFPLVQQAINKGIQRDSFRKALNRAGIKSKAVNLPGLWARAHAEKDNELRMRFLGANKAPLPGTTMLPAQFKEPWNYRYIVRVNMLNPDTGASFTRDITLWENERIRVGTAAEAGLQYARDQQANQRDTNPKRTTERWDTAGYVPTHAFVVNAFYNSETGV